MSRNEGEQEPVVVRDRRRIDPETGQRRAPAPNGEEAQVPDSISGTLDEAVAEAGTAAESDSAAEPAQGESAGLQQQVDELTADLKRVTAEYANYRKRVERDRESVIAGAKASVAGDLLTVLDDLERAEAHGDLNGAFKAVADKLVTTLNSAGLEAFGAEGDEFDPSVHEAVQHSTSPEVSGPTVTAVLRRGYRFADRVLRPAMVAVTDHEPAAAADENQAEQG
ncbi:molecular chaperone GrpE [Saccharopolyspora kobensis]|uniref:Protein GrpE n=1 Tax=Saccharopolyspora kobensis TaxID=146035 RepID=A0A1H6E2E1_9PSEU|nr:nucleotide exchange factor GrpE [Saccharopolyspora kobensis]SEG91479.1 molecular chaperone GrpE [Saccharopolyspora kobensis]SFF15727.1 molecular chaperone GrpE [Saccharopolyspora kobensis]